MNNLQELKEKRANLVTEMRELTKSESFDQEKFNQLEEEYRKLGENIEREERMAQYETELNQKEEVRAGNKQQPTIQKRDVKQGRETEEYRSAFWQGLTYGKGTLDADQQRQLNEARSLSIGTDANGGFVVPDEFERELVKGLEEQNVMRSYANVLTTGSGTREIPVLSSHGDASWLGEAGTYTETNPTYDQVTLSAHKLGAIVKVSEELLQDSFFNIGNHVRNEFATIFGKKEEAAFINGDGVGKPLGIVNSAEEGTVGATGQTTSVTTDDLIDLYHSLSVPYRKKAVFLMNDETAKAIRKLKDSDGQYIWQPGLQAGQPDRLFGRPVVISSAMPTMAASAKSILFGDLSKYTIADRTGRAMQRLDEKYADVGQVGYRMYQRVDGKLLLPEAVKYYQNAAS